MNFVCHKNGSHTLHTKTSMYMFVCHALYKGRRTYTYKLSAAEFEVQ